jgi:uncharacterized protein (DUF4415 family)
MQTENDLKRYTLEEIRQMRAKGESKTNWEAVNSMTEADIAASRMGDADVIPLPEDWNKIIIGLPEPKAQLTLRVDRDVLDWFKDAGKGYQTRINAVLRSYVQSARNNQSTEHTRLR